METFSKNLLKLFFDPDKFGFPCLINKMKNNKGKTEKNNQSKTFKLVILNKLLFKLVKFLYFYNILKNPLKMKFLWFSTGG